MNFIIESLLILNALQSNFGTIAWITRALFLLISLLNNLCAKYEPTHYLTLIYKNAFIKKIMTHRLTSNFIGLFANSSISKYLISTFIKIHTINTDEIDRELKNYHTLNDFFSRKLKPNARKINEDKKFIIAPADGSISIINEVNDSDAFTIKQDSFDLITFLQDKKLAESFTEGTLLIIYLAPHNYHRFHFPFDCIPETSVSINGTYHSVHPWLRVFDINPLLANKREFVILKNDLFGEVLFVCVGAMFVASITHTYVAHQSYTKGAEMGYFCFGGSTIAMLFKKNQVKIVQSLKEKIHQSSQRTVPIKMGTAVLEIVSTF